MYLFYLGGLLLPVAPEKVVWKTEGQNRQFQMVNMEQYAGFSTVGRIDAYDESDCPGEDVKTQETAEIACDPRGISRIFKRKQTASFAGSHMQE